MADLESPTSAARPHGHPHRGYLAAAALILAVGTAAWVWYSLNSDSTVVDDDQVAAADVREVPTSRFLNTRDATRVGSQRCLECHADHFASHRSAGMGQSSAPVDLNSEPTGGTVEHAESNRRYEVFRRDGTLWCSESLLKEDTHVLLGEYELSYRVGSGRFARTYLSNADGFWVECPVTWYESRQVWDMSPGYDEPNQQGFERAVTQQCLRCHVGESREIDASHRRMEIGEDWISCERCHGPGSIHVAYQSGEVQIELDDSVTGDVDHTIVNPKHLTRELADDVCAQCHEHPQLTLPAPDRDQDDFRPGLPLDAFRVTYGHEEQHDHGMTVVGHIGQMRLSRCYQASDMSCITCHSPHHRPDPGKTLTHYRQACLQCHEPAHCGSPQPDRLKLSPQDDCVQCHMPRSDTEIPHVAFTHHRIGIHEPNRATGIAQMEHELSEPLELIPSSDVSFFTPYQQKTLLGAANVDYGLSGAGSAFAETYQRRGYRLLLNSWNEEPLSPSNAARLAFLAVQRKSPRAPLYFEHTLEHSLSELSAEARINAMLSNTFWLLEQNRLAEAADVCRQLTTVGRSSIYYDLLAQIESARGQSQAAAEAMETAVAIDPRRTSLRQRLVEYYTQTKNESRAAYHAERLPESP